MSRARLIALAIAACLTICGCVSKPPQNAFIFAPSTIDQQLDTASIEDYIIALPPYAFHEEGVQQFTQRVRQARIASPENKGMHETFLFVEGDGCWPSKDFTLSRKDRTLHIRIYHWEPGLENTVSKISMRRVMDGWIRSPELTTTNNTTTHDPL